MNVEIGTEAALFPEKEYINGIFLAVWHYTAGKGDVCITQSMTLTALAFVGELAHT
jgi:hypothetical protein